MNYKILLEAANKFAGIAQFISEEDHWPDIKNPTKADLIDARLLAKELSKVCTNCGHSKDNHIFKLIKDQSIIREQCTELVETGGFRTAPKQCPCKTFTKL